MAVPASMPSSTANWHWKNKNCTPWARTWFQRELCTIELKGDGQETVTVSQVTGVDGDVELGQRKSKLITIYDCKVELNWTGTASDGTDVSGKLVIPEVSHETTLDGSSDYVYEWSLTTDRSPAVDGLFQLVKSRLPTALETKFAEFPSALLDTHGKDLQVVGTPSNGTPSASGTSTPIPGQTSATGAPAPKKPAPSNTNTKTVTSTSHFQADANDLFSLFTDEKRISMWTRAPAQSSAKPDTDYTLFGGGVRGKYVSLTPGKEIVQTWALQSPTWPSGHYATMTTTLDQGSDSTKVTFSLDGVPVGMEDEISRNIEGYYVHGLKSIGLGTEL